MRIDSASRMIRASAATIYGAFAKAEAMEAWLPPAGMRGEMRSFAFCDGVVYRMRLTYQQPQTNVGKTSAEADEVTVEFVKLVENQRIEQAVKFESDDPSFHGEMRITW